MSNDANTESDPNFDEEMLIEDAAGAVEGSTLDDPDHLADNPDQIPSE